MFAQHAFIDESHKVLMASVIRQHAVVTEKLFARLYEVAHNVIKSGGTTERHSDISWSFVGDADQTKVASVTDEKTGIFVKLVQPASGNRLLTCGQNWALQGKVQSAIAAKVW